MGARNWSFRICAALVALAGAAIAVAWLGNAYPPWRAVRVCQTSGYASLLLLLASLAVAPVLKVSELLRFPLQRAAASAFRRRAGISAALLALVHAALALSTYLRDSWDAVLDWSFTRAGLASLIVLALLLGTSFPWAVSLLRLKLWKELHRLAYVAGAFAVLHVLQAPFAPSWRAIAVLSGFLALMALRLLPRRRST